jgi:hypothetical protein
MLAAPHQIRSARCQELITSHRLHRSQLVRPLDRIRSRLASASAWPRGEHANLWGSLRRRCGCLFVVREAACCMDRLIGAGRLVGIGRTPPFLTRMPALPFRLNQDRRHHISRQQRKVMNWPAYEAGLRQHGSLTVWFTDEAVAAWAAEPRRPAVTNLCIRRRGS